MVRSGSIIYKVLLKCLPKNWENKPFLIWHWDAQEMLQFLNEYEFKVQDGYSPNDTYAMYVPGDGGEQGAIHAPVRISWSSYATMIFTFLHELAHANGFDDESEADDEAFKVYKNLNRRKAWRELEIKVYVRKTKDPQAVPDDLVYTEPARPEAYSPHWEEGTRYY